MSNTKTLFKEEIYMFIDYLVDVCNIKHVSIARSIKTPNSTKIRNKTFGYKSAIKIRDNYINNYNDFINIR